MAYLPIEDYGVIGNLHTVALVGRNGSIDWWCPPKFDSPSVFAAILDDERGGRFSIGPVSEDVRRKQIYIPDTNVLISRFLSPDGVVEVTDFMPIGAEPSSIVRSVEAIRGTMALRVHCEPAFSYATVPHDLRASKDGVAFESAAGSLRLTASIPLTMQGPAAVADFAVKQGDRATFIVTATERGAEAPPHPPDADVEHICRETIRYWQQWLSQCTYRGRWREMIHRSALTLKLLTYAPTGAIVAAATTSLPESIGGTRNWDYRYTWIRDASFTLYALIRIGFHGEARAFMDWVRARLHEIGPDGSLQVMYSIDGAHDLPERTLDHLSGYRGSRPVRVGNAAHRQLQLDLYGELLDAVYLFNKHGTPIGYDDWVQLEQILNHVCKIWKQPDHGIWEVRGGPRHFVHSKVLCWVALDRGLRLADKRSFPAKRDPWLDTRDAIYTEIMKRGWSEKRRTFMQAYDSPVEDASALIMPLVFFVSARDPRFVATVEAIRRELATTALVRRYQPDEKLEGVEGTEGTFSICTFWLVEALTRIGQIDEARLLFERMLGYANHLGLYSEQIGPSGEALGNFPQAFTHLGLITAAVNLDRALGSRGESDPTDEP